MWWLSEGVGCSNWMGGWNKFIIAKWLSVEFSSNHMNMLWIIFINSYTNNHILSTPGDLKESSHIFSISIIPNLSFTYIYIYIYILIDR